jgi:Na+/melibiose symporter-like transporter
MRTIAPRLVELLDSWGIDSLVFMTLLGFFLCLWTIKSLRRWGKLIYYKRWLLVTELVGSAVVTLIGCAFLLMRCSQ